MALHQTVLPTRPAKRSQVGQQVWTVWTMLLYFINSVYDSFANKFEAGTAVIGTGATTVVVIHSLETINFAVAVTPQSDPGARVWVSGKTASQFTINLSGAAAANVYFDWMVQAI